MQSCSNGSKARQWFTDANGDGFVMLKIMHADMLKNLVGDQARLVVQSALNRVTNISIDLGSASNQHTYSQGMMDFREYVKHANVTIKDDRLLATLISLVNS